MGSVQPKDGISLHYDEYDTGSGFVLSTPPPFDSPIDRDERREARRRGREEWLRSLPEAVRFLKGKGEKDGR